MRFGSECLRHKQLDGIGRHISIFNKIQRHIPKDRGILEQEAKGQSFFYQLLPISTNGIFMDHAQEHANHKGPLESSVNQVQLIFTYLFSLIKSYGFTY